MIFYLKGRVVFKDKDSIVIDVHDVAYQVLVSHIDSFKVGEEIVLYTYSVVREDEEYLVGFSSLEEKNVFLSLIKVKGLGPKTAINALSTTTPDLVLQAIASNNVAYLKKLPGIGAKAAAQIILDLKGQLTGTNGNPGVYDEVYDALKELGYKGAAIDRVLSSINEPDLDAEQLLRVALSKMRK